jgi:hypothetical protein
MELATPSWNVWCRYGGMADDRQTFQGPLDPVQLAKFIVDIAMGEAIEGKPTTKEARAKKTGSKGRPTPARRFYRGGAGRYCADADEARWRKRGGFVLPPTTP